MCAGPYVPHYFFLIFFNFFFLYFFNDFYFFHFFCSFIFLFFLISFQLKNNKIIKKNTAFWGLQIYPSSIEFMSVTSVSNEMK